MPININDLTYELFSQIIDTVFRFNEDQNPRKMPDLDRKLQAQWLSDVQMQGLFIGTVTPDSVRWAASNTIRQIGSRWHEVALEYTFADLYVLPWRGSEKYTHLGVARKRQSLADSSEPRSFLRKTAELLENHPTLSSYIRRVWFHGYYEAKESDMILRSLQRCKKLEDLWVSWTVLRHGNVADWASLFGFDSASPRIKALVVRATSLPKRCTAMKKKNHFDNKMLESVSVDFTSLAVLRFLGNSNFMMITDKDLMAIARTAKNLREIHLSNAGPVGPKGIEALIRSSQLSLEVLELDGLSRMIPEQIEQHNSHSHPQLFRLVAQCPLLRRLRLQSIRACREIFACDNLAWSGEVQIYIGANSSFQVPQPEKDTTVLCQVLYEARCLMDSRTRTDEKCIEIEIFASGFMFEPRCALVHGDFPTTCAVREPWLAQKKESQQKVPMIGYVRELPFCVTEDEFKDGLNKGYVWL